MNVNQIIAAAKAGDVNAIAELYQQNRGLMYRYVHRYNDQYPMDDLMQEAYFAMIKAVEAYDYDRGYTFTTYLINALRWYFTRYIKRDKNGLDYCILDAPISAQEADGATRAEMIEDESAAFEDDTLHRAAMANVLSLIKDALNTEKNQHYYDVLYWHYVEKISLVQIAEMLGCSFQNVQQMKDNAMRILRHPRHKALHSYRDDVIGASYHHNTLTEFRYTHTSSVEWAAEKLIR